MLIQQMLTSNNTTPLTAQKLAELENGSVLEQALYQAQITQDFAPFYMETAASFNKAFAAAASCVTIRQLVQLQTAWFDLGISNNWGADDKAQEEATLRIVQQVINCSLDELENLMDESGMDFCYQLCYAFIKDHDDFNQMRKA